MYEIKKDFPYGDATRWPSGHISPSYHAKTMRKPCENHAKSYGHLSWAIAPANNFVRPPHKVWQYDGRQVSGWTAAFSFFAGGGVTTIRERLCHVMCSQLKASFFLSIQDQESEESRTEKKGEHGKPLKAHEHRSPDW